MGKSDARRAEILTIAWRVFLEHGYGSASMTDIATRVGGSKTTLYNYFANKEDLFLAAVELKARKIKSDFVSSVIHSDNLRSDLIEFGRKLLRIAMSGDYSAFYRVMIFESVRFPMIAKLAIDGRRETVIKPIAKRLSEEMNAGRLRELDPLDAAEVFWDLCSASLHWQAVLGLASEVGKADIDRYVDRAVAVFLASYEARVES